ncbi:MAG TPA: CBS domain-containing protein [Actinomycetota bacterium]|nr:CBS domain-containing protein [Actinomycetota bacterium]
MGFIGTIATFGIGYAAGAISGRQGLERLSTRVSESLPQQVRSALPQQLRTGNGSSSTVDVREVRQVMTAAPHAVRLTSTLQEASRIMKAKDIGDVLVEDAKGQLSGIVTDRDLAIRATAEGADPTTTKVSSVYTKDITTLAPTDTVQDAIRQMRANDVRRLPVVEGGKAIGIVSLGDISIETAPNSLLADISRGTPDP